MTKFTRITIFTLICENYDIYAKYVIYAKYTVHENCDTPTGMLNVLNQVVVKNVLAYLGSSNLSFCKAICKSRCFWLQFEPPTL